MLCAEALVEVQQAFKQEIRSFEAIFLQNCETILKDLERKLQLNGERLLAERLPYGSEESLSKLSCKADSKTTNPTLKPIAALHEPPPAMLPHTILLPSSELAPILPILPVQRVSNGGVEAKRDHLSVFSHDETVDGSLASSSRSASPCVSMLLGSMDLSASSHLQPPLGLSCSDSLIPSSKLLTPRRSHETGRASFLLDNHERHEKRCFSLPPQTLPMVVDEPVHPSNSILEACKKKKATKLGKQTAAGEEQRNAISTALTNARICAKLHQERQAAQARVYKSDARKGSSRSNTATKSCSSSSFNKGDKTPSVPASRETSTISQESLKSSMSHPLFGFMGFRPLHFLIDTLKRRNHLETPNRNLHGIEVDDPSICVHFELLDCWKRDQDDEDDPLMGPLMHRLRSAPTNALFKNHLGSAESLGDIVHPVRQEDPFLKYMIPPNSIRRIFWDILGTAFIMYDGVMAPLQAFDLTETAFAEKMGWMTRVFWTLDIAVHFFSGYCKVDGDSEMRPKQVALRYLKTWLFPDIFVVAIDWFDVIAHSSAVAGGSDNVRILRILRALRIIRILRLLRVGKLAQNFERIGEVMPMYFTFAVRAAASVLKIMGLILLIAHILACIWYAVGDSNNSHDTWIKANQLEDAATAYLYLTSFHWSLTQFSGTMEVSPRNSVERFVAVVTLLFSYLASTLFVSSLTSSMTRFELASSRRTRMFSELRRYMQLHNTPSKLALRLTRNAIYAFNQRERHMEERSVELLHIVSEPILMELHRAMYSPVIELHPFFASLKNEFTYVQNKIYHNAVKFRHFLPGDTIFSFGEEPESLEMLFVRQGLLVYLQHMSERQRLSMSASMQASQMKSYDLSRASVGATISDEASVTECIHGHWLCEANLWVRWNYFGELRAIEAAELLVIEAFALQRVITQNQLIVFYRYAKEFAKWLSQTAADDLTDVGCRWQVADISQLAWTH